MAGILRGEGRGNLGVLLKGALSRAQIPPLQPILMPAG